ncbi:hypothetical protein EVAR_97536_1 [Eumeta japonica]|uniref:Uncharacterized protein n=1 Tax=Eumeta variegata TaxID=151549 RepID=A0A4C1WKT6_EUMVA|nr:hypothetical protein EVAR_97536_1 [Eumeta japonica]
MVARCRSVIACAWAGGRRRAVTYPNKLYLSPTNSSCYVRTYSDCLYIHRVRCTVRSEVFNGCEGGYEVHWCDVVGERGIYNIEPTSHIEMLGSCRFYKVRCDDNSRSVRSPVWDLEAAKEAGENQPSTSARRLLDSIGPPKYTIHRFLNSLGVKNYVVTTSPNSYVYNSQYARVHNDQHSIRNLHPAENFALVQDNSGPA